VHPRLPLTIASFKHARDVAFASTPFAAGLRNVGVAPMGDEPAKISQMWISSIVSILVLLGAAAEPISAQTTGDQAKQLTDEQIAKALATARCRNGCWSQEPRS
jgi:hypothetical protein